MFNKIIFPENCTDYEIMWISTVEAERPQITIWRMRIAYWIPKAVNTHSDYAILIAFPRKQWLHEHTSLLHYMCIACFVLPWWLTKIRIGNLNIESVLRMLVQT